MTYQLMRVINKIDLVDQKRIEDFIYKVQILDGVVLKKSLFMF